jgi:hypothetical protein
MLDSDPQSALKGKVMSFLLHVFFMNHLHWALENSSSAISSFRIVYLNSLSISKVKQSLYSDVIGV